MKRSGQPAKASFPRGREAASAPSAVEGDEPKPDFLFGSEAAAARPAKRRATAGGRKKSGGGGGGGGSDDDDGGAAASMALPKRARQLTFKRLSVGMTLLAQVKDVGKESCTLSLPHSLTGTVRLSELSDAHFVQHLTGDGYLLPGPARFLEPGQLLSCSVAGLQKASAAGRNRVELSLRASVVNASLAAASFVPGLRVHCCVTSVEDHGYAVSLGVAGASGFLAFDQAHSQTLRAGQPLSCVVLPERRSSRVLALSSLRMEKAVAKPFPGMAIQTLLPGTLVSATVSKVLSGGSVLSFLSFFHGTVDRIHQGFGEEHLEVKEKVRARILFVDANARTIGLSLLKHVVAGSPFTPPDTAQLGDIIEEAAVAHVEPSLGIFLAIPGAIAFAHLSNLADKHTDVIGKAHAVGKAHRCRITGYSMMDGVVNVTLKESVLSQQIMRYEDVKVAMTLQGKILAIESFGLRVALTDHIQAICPTMHCTEVAQSQKKSKFTVGGKVTAQVLLVDPSRNRVVLTMKKSLRSSTLPRICTYADAVPGSIAEGFVQAIRDFGLIVSFYNGVHGIAPKLMLGVSDITKGVMSPAECFRTGQTVKVKVIACAPDNEKMTLSLDLEHEAQKAATTGRVRDYVGKNVSGRVSSVTDSVVGIVLDEVPDHMTAELSKEHTSDHPQVCNDVILTYRVGDAMSDLLVLDAHESSHKLILTRKPSLLLEASRGNLPREVADIAVGKVLHGYVKRVTTFGVFVSFVGSLTGLAMRSNVADEFVKDPSDFFSPGDSCRALVTKLDADAGKFELSLKQSACFSDTTTFLISYFADLDRIALASQQTAGDSAASDAQFAIGTTVTGVVQSKKSYGVIVDLQDDVTGFINSDHLSPEVGACSPGDTVECRVMDADWRKRIVDLTSRSDLMKGRYDPSRSKKRKKASGLQGSVILVKDAYNIVAIANKTQLDFAFAARKDFNSRKQGAPSNTKPNSSASVQLLESSDRQAPHSRLLCRLETAGNGRAEKGLSLEDLHNGIQGWDDVYVGLRVTGKVSSVNALQVNVVLARGVTGRIHITEASDAEEASVSFAGISSAGQLVKVKVLSIQRRSIGDGIDQRVKSFVELSMRPCELAVEEIVGRPELEALRVGSKCHGIVGKVSSDNLLVLLDSTTTARVSAVDASTSIATAQNLAAHFMSGQRCAFTVVGMDGQRSIELSLVPAVAVSSEGTEVLAQITRIAEDQGLFLRLPGLNVGRAHITDVDAKMPEDPLQKFTLGEIITCRVCGVGARNQVDVTLIAAKDAAPPVVAADLKVGQKVAGYVRGASKRGCFVNLSRVQVGRILVSQLSDGFVEHIERSFPNGLRVTARVTAINSSNGNVDLSLKGTASSSEKYKYEDLTLSQVVMCTVRRVETFGLFLTIEKTSLTGLCHKSELNDESASRFKPRSYAEGDRVKAKVLRLRPDEKKISFGIKPSYFDADDAGSDDAVLSSDESEGEAVSSDEDDSAADSAAEDAESESETEVATNGGATLEVASEFGLDALEPAAKRAFGRQRAGSSSDDEPEESSDEEPEVDYTAGRNNSLSAEEARTQNQEDSLADDTITPTTEDGFKRRLIATPHESMLWIKYMAFQLSLGEIDKAREIVKQALNTISFRQAEEKFNMWVALLNLEKMYGTKETVFKAFDQAVVYNDPKRVYVKMVDIHTRATDWETVEELYKSMVKKFKRSPDVWVQYGAFKIGQSKTDEAKGVLERSFIALEKSKHVSVIAKFAEAEFKTGSAERGRTYFEGILENAPKRVDIWSVYLDMETKIGDAERIRRLYDRATSLSLSTKKMKHLFTRYLGFEKTQGESSRVEHVKQKAQEFVAGQ